MMSSGSSPYVYDAFISYRRRDPDKAFARDLLRNLEDKGYGVALDELDFRANQPVLTEMERCVKESRFTLCVISPRYFDSGNCIEEAIICKVLDMADRKRRLVPLILEQVEMPIWMYDITGIRYDDPDPLIAPFEKLCKTLGEPVCGKTKARTGLPPQNLPFQPLGTLFKGRDQALEDLHKALSEGGAAAVVQQRAIFGLGGIGKTRLAIEYAWQHKNDYTALLFVTADSPSALNANLAALAGPTVLNLPEQDEPNEAAKVAAVLRWLAHHPDWLLILDNVDSDEAAQAALRTLPHLQGGSVLLTSRRANWPASIRKQQLDRVNTEKAVEFLLQRTDGRRRPQPDDAERARALAELLDGLPLALELAGAYIARMHWTFARYLDHWETAREKALQWNESIETQYPYSIAVAWQTNFDQLSPAARAILNICAWLAPDPIPQNLFEGQDEILAKAMQQVQAEHGPKQRSPARAAFNADEALADLAAYCLITPGDEAHPGDAAFTVHRLVQEVVRSRIPPKQRRDWIETALRLVNNRVPGDADDVRTWPVMDPLRRHAATVASYADDARITDPTARLMNQLGLYLEAKALYAEAEPLMRHALAMSEATLGPDHPNVATALNNLAQLLQATNRLAEAEPLMRRTLAISEASFGPDHPDVAIRLNNLAQLLQATNRLAQAEPLMRRALAISEASFGPDHPNVAIRLNNLATLLQATNRLAEAEPLMRRALAMSEATLGPDHPNVARDLNNLAQLLQATNRLAEAEPLMRRALAISEASFGPDHPNVATDLNNLAQLLQATNRLAEAEPLMRRALAIGEATLGRGHPDVATTLNNLAGLLLNTNRLTEAEPLMRRALAIDETSLGPYHPTVATDLNNLALLLQSANRLAEAEPLMRRALAIDEASFGPDHPNVATDLNNLALLLKATNRLAEAEPLMRRALAIVEASLGPDHPNTQTARENLEGMQTHTTRRKKSVRKGDKGDGEMSQEA